MGSSCLGLEEVCRKGFQSTALSLPPSPAFTSALGGGGLVSCSHLCKTHSPLSSLDLVGPSCFSKHLWESPDYSN